MTFGDSVSSRRVVELAHRARSVAVVQSAGGQDSQHAMVLHTMLWTHDVMLEFSRCETKNHPTFSSEFVEYLAAHSNTKLVMITRAT